MKELNTALEERLCLSESFDLVRRVLDCGHRRIGVIPALESSQAGRERNRAVRDVLEKAECRYLCSAVGGFDRQTGTEGFPS